MDKTLRSKSSLERHRNVLSRAERIDRMKESGLWTESSRAIGLPKIAHRKAAVGKKDKAEKKAEEGAASTASAAAPAADAAKKGPESKKGADAKKGGDKK